LALFSLLLLAACAGPAESQQRLPTETIVIDTARGPVRLLVEIADDFEPRERGLMYRREMAADAGMLFVFPRPQITVFWMRNTYIPLDMLFVRGNGTISTIAPDVKILSDNRTSSEEPVLAVIEINAGRAAALGIVPGDKVHARAFRNAVP
jgi:uncharacterized membrane protein (UPF0127 family)